MATTKSKKITVAEFEAMFEAVKNWGRWGKDDDRGTLNYITPEHVRKAAGLVRSGRTVSMAIPINTVAGPDNPHPAIHYMSRDRKSTRLNSSHTVISYAVFCLKKKKD